MLVFCFRSIWRFLSKVTQKDFQIFILFVLSSLSSLSRSSAVPYQIQLLNSPLEYNSGFHSAPILKVPTVEDQLAKHRK